VKKIKEPMRLGVKRNVTVTHISHEPRTVIGPDPDTRSASPAASTKAIKIENCGAASPASYMVVGCNTAVSGTALVVLESTGCSIMSVDVEFIVVAGLGLVIIENLAGMTSNA
jgi:hypothetical protein